MFILSHPLSIYPVQVRNIGKLFSIVISYQSHWLIICRFLADTTEQLRFHFSLSCTGEGHGNPLQCSCLENPRDRGAWWASVYGVAQRQTLLKRLSSSSSKVSIMTFIQLAEIHSLPRKPFNTFTFHGEIITSLISLNCYKNLEKIIGSQI